MPEGAWATFSQIKVFVGSKEKCYLFIQSRCLPSAICPCREGNSQEKAIGGELGSG